MFEMQLDINYKPNLIEAIARTAPFESEAALITIVLKNITQFFDDEKFCFTTEVPVGSGIVDVMAGRVQRNIASTSQRFTITSIEAFILSKLHVKKRLSDTVIAIRTNISIEQIRCYLRDLCDKGLCFQFGHCYVKIAPILSGITAIEGKTKNWKRALQQATRNKLFSCQSFVALDAKYSRSALKNLELFKEYRVGLAIVFREGAMHIVYRPPESKPIAPIMPIVAEFELLNKVYHPEQMDSKSNDKCYNA